jgi:hypothetical protein
MIAIVSPCVSKLNHDNNKNDNSLKKLLTARGYL